MHYSYNYFKILTQLLGAKLSCTDAFKWNPSHFYAINYWHPKKKKIFSVDIFLPSFHNVILGNKMHLSVGGWKRKQFLTKCCTHTVYNPIDFTYSIFSLVLHNCHCHFWQMSLSFLTPSISQFNAGAILIDFHMHLTEKKSVHIKLEA